jgi:hypothetical protein
MENKPSYKDRKEKNMTPEDFKLWKLRRNNRNSRRKEIKRINQEQAKLEEQKQMVIYFVAEFGLPCFLI